MSKKGNRNALKHGGFSEMVILPDEDPEEFKALHADLIEEWNPQGRLQKDKVFDIAKNMWRKFRLSHHVNERIAKVVRNRELEDWNDKRELKRMISVYEDLTSGKSISEQELSTRLPKKYAEFYTKNRPRTSYDSDEAWAEAVAKSLDWFIERLPMLTGLLPKIGEEFCDPSTVVSDLEIEERLDAKIHRDLIALGQMKTMQAMGLGGRAAISEEPKSITLKKIDSPSLQAEGSKVRVDKKER